MNIKQVYETVHRFGFNAAAQDIACRAASKVTEVTILRGIRLTMDSVDPLFLADEAGYDWGFIDGATLHGALRRGAPLAMDANFVDDAIARGDRCYGALQGDTIAAYGWYSTHPTPVTSVADDMVFHFDSAYAYMYRGYTLPEHRGRRLHGIGMARAMEAHAQGGSRGLVSIVDATNFPSLASCFRLGYRSFGQIFCAKIAGHHLTYATKGCEPYGVFMGPAKN